MRRMMNTGEVKTAESVNVATDNTPVISAPEAKTTEVQKNSAPVSSQDEEKSVPLVDMNNPDKLKFQEILTHLKTVMLVSILCLAIVGSLYFLELKIHWVDQILLSPLFSGK